MKRISIFVLCLALISLACLEVSDAAIQVAEPAQMVTRSKITPAPSAISAEIETAAAITSQLCARVIAATAENLRSDADPRSRILTHLLNGDVVQVLDQADRDWWHVKRGDDIGFARSIYLEEVECVK